MNIISIPFCIFSVLFLKELQGLIISSIDVPSLVPIENEDVQPIKLDCDYRLEGPPKNLIVKWLKDDILIYQWIYGQKPSVIIPFQDDVREYEDSGDPIQQFSGIELISPKLTSSGFYKCVVRNFENGQYKENLMEKKLQIVHVVNHTLKLNHRRIENETHVECSISNVFPKPKLHLVADDGDLVQIISSDEQEDENGFFNATTIAVVGDDDEDPDSYICTVMFPGLPFNLTRSAYSGSAARTLKPVFLLLFFVLLCLEL